jgi:hypothetical protein
VVLVELDEQRGVPTEDEALRIIANLVRVGPPPLAPESDQGTENDAPRVDANAAPAFMPEAEANVAIGRRVRVVFQPLDDQVALPQFMLTDEPPEGRVWQMPE